MFAYQWVLKFGCSCERSCKMLQVLLSSELNFSVSRYFISGTPSGIDTKSSRMRLVFVLVCR